jgi:aryl-alcohol dehydrogenase-like predicted oxidoreductase
VAGAFRASRAAGLDFFDTAEAYGRGLSERILGRLVADGPDGPIVATKLFPYPWRLTRRAVVPTLRASLRRLGLERVDLYQLHWPFPPVPIESWMEGFAEALDLGLTRAVGVSNFSVRQMERAQAALGRRGHMLTSNQVEYSLLQRSPERSGLLEACRAEGITLIAYSPLAQGLVTGKYAPGRPPPLTRRRRMGRRLGAITPLIDALRDVGAAHGGKTPAQVALNWTVVKGSLPIPGAKNPRQAEENAGARGWRLTADEVARLDEVSDRVTHGRGSPGAS